MSEKVYQNTSLNVKKNQIINFLTCYTGENFFNPKTKKWAKVKGDDNKRSFNMYVLDPIYKVSAQSQNFRETIVF